jgi:hypothetical protein
MFEGLMGTTPLASLTPRNTVGSRPGTSDIVRVGNPSVLVYDIAGKGFERFRGVVGIENAREQIGSTLNPQIRFFVFDAPPNMERLIPPAPETPVPQSPPLTTAAQVIDRVFWYALGRAPTIEERRAAEVALRNPAGGTRPSAQGLADLLWAVTMKPEFQLIY